MARPGVTYLDVAKAATALFEQNIRPSIEGVRRLLGTGSNSTIGQHLRDWREKQGSQLELKQGLPESLLIAVKGLYKAMQAETTLKIETIKTDSEATITALKKQVSEMKLAQTQLTQQQKIAEEKIALVQAENTALQTHLQKAQMDNEKQQTEKDQLLNQLDDKKIEIERLLKQLTHAQHNLDHYRESIRQERESDRQYFDEKIVALEQQRRLQQEKLSEREQKLAALTQQLKTFQADKEKSEQELNSMMAHCQRYEINQQHQATQYRHLNERYAKLNEQHKTLTEKTKRDEKKQHQFTLENERLKTQCAALEKSLEKTESSLRHFTDKHVFLAQEKSVLETQLKQVLATQVTR